MLLFVKFCATISVEDISKKIGGNMNKKFPEENDNLLPSSEVDDGKLNIKEETDSSDYYPLGADPRSRSLLFSALSIVFAALSIIFFSFYYLSIPFAVISIVCAVISRIRLGYFDKGAIFGLIFAIFGLVFGVGSLILDCLGYLDALLGKE